MHIIKTHQDVISLKSSRHSSALTNYISEYFDQLQTMLSREDEAEFSLQNYGQIIILKQGRSVLLSYLRSGRGIWRLIRHPSRIC